MQSIIDRQTTLSPLTVPTSQIVRASFPQIRKKLAHRLDLVTVVTLLISAASYCVYALLHIA